MQTPLGELTTLPRPPICRNLLLRGKKGERRGHRRGRQGRNGKRGEGQLRHSISYPRAPQT